MQRKSVVSGHFYPENQEELLEYFEHFEKMALPHKEFKSVRALIVPHAGYIYSGQTAYFAYKIASSHKYKRVIIIGPSHRVGFEGASVSLFNSYQTPLGDIDIDLAYAKNLVQNYEFLGFHEDCHKEHSTETQAPFIKHYLPTTKVIEIVYSKLEAKKLSQMVDAMLDDEENLLIISTDLSHFYSLEKANALDAVCIEAIQAQEPKKLHEGCEACGAIGVEALLHVSSHHNLHVKILDYTTSAKQNGDESRVVGYVSAVLGH